MRVCIAHSTSSESKTSTSSSTRITFFSSGYAASATGRVPRRAVVERLLLVALHDGEELAAPGAVGVDGADEAGIAFWQRL
jgi:hypothetical protein